MRKSMLKRLTKAVNFVEKNPQDPARRDLTILVQRLSAPEQMLWKAAKEGEMER